MASLFLDSSGWFAAMSPPDRDHARARESYATAASHGAQLVTTTLVIAEVHTLVVRWRGSRDGERFLSLALESGAHVVIHPDADIVQSALDRWIRRFSDQAFSICDAVSFEVMRRRRLTRALTFDQHFRVAGFETL
jgi:predicted nucleic acid-binding protein